MNGSDAAERLGPRSGPIRFGVDPPFTFPGRTMDPNHPSRRTSGVVPVLAIGLLAFGCLGLAGCSLEAVLGEPEVGEMPPEILAQSEERLVLMKFGATWCGPCKKIDKELDQLERSGVNLQVVRVDIDQSPALARQFHVSSIPHLVLVRDGKTLDKQVGYRSEADLRRWASRYEDIGSPTADASGPAAVGVGQIQPNPFAAVER